MRKLKRSAVLDRRLGVVRPGFERAEILHLEECAMSRIRLLLLTKEIDAADWKANLAKIKRMGLKVALVATLPSQDRARLTPRQTDVLRGIALGRRTKEMARELGISVKTVETFRQQLFAKLGIRHVAGLVRYALRSGVVPIAWLLE